MGRPAFPVTRSSVRKRSVGIGGRKTSVSLEDAFWKALGEIGAAQGATRIALITRIDAGRHGINLSSAIRLFVLEFYRERAWNHTPSATAAPSIAPTTGAQAGNLDES
jgi:predicted DNA-binding ribbon-helix-helix protein